ncbi:site-specific integrase [Salmonella enterica]|nr:site-specific integrase [Salmonella enterica]
MTIRKLDDGRWLVDVRPAGTDGKRFRRRFDTRGEAVAYERHVLMYYHDRAWVDKPPDRRALTELFDLWWKYHGSHHPHGEQDRVRIAAVLRDLKTINVTRVDQLTGKGIVNYRAMMMNKGVKKSTINRYCMMMSGFFTRLITAQEYSGENPFREIKRLKTEQPEMSWLSVEEVALLLEHLSGDDRKAAMLCLATGGRWGEVAQIKGEHVIGGKVVFMKTKNGRRRTVPVDSKMEKMIKVRATGRLLFPDYATVRATLRIVKPDLPDGQATHVLRHTFATHFMMNGGNIITLQRILGHATIQQTMTYAHFAPDFLQEAVSYNPIAGMSLE